MASALAQASLRAGSGCSTVMSRQQPASDPLKVLAASLKASAQRKQAAQGYHYDMMHDSERNRKYAQALHADVRDDDFVLDVGCGSGLLSLLASRTVAQHVFACEADPMLCEAARAVIGRNDADDRVTIRGKMSTDLVVGWADDLPCRADVLVTEIFDSVLIGEGVLATLRDARARYRHIGDQTLGLASMAKPWLDMVRRARSHAVQASRAGWARHPARRHTACSSARVAVCRVHVWAECRRPARGRRGRRPTPDPYGVLARAGALPFGSHV